MTETAQIPQLRKITLEEPVQLGDAPAIAELFLRKPKSGDARGGISLFKVGQGDVDEVLKVLPRICTPVLSPAEIDAIEWPDLVQITDAVTDFLLTKAQLAALQAQKAALSPTT